MVEWNRRRGSVWECLNHPWIFPRSPGDTRLRQDNQINMDNLRNYQARKRWKHSMKVVFLCNRLSRTKLRGSWLQLCESPAGQAGYDSPVPADTPDVSNMATGSCLDPEDDNFVLSAIFCAIEEDNKGGLEELLNVANIDINQTNKHGESGVHIAAGLGRLEMLRVLAGHGANLGQVDQQGDSAVYWAARQGHTQAIQYLVEQGVHVNQQNKLGECCLHAGCKYGHSQVIQYLVSIHTHVDLQDSHLEASLHIAAWHGFPRIVEILCQAGASVDIKNEEDETPLHVAAARGHIECIRCLLDCSSTSDGTSVIDSQDKRGSTPLHLALRRNHSHVALLLLHSGADFDLPDSEGETPIHICAREGQLGLAQTLCAFGCNVDLPNAEGMQPLHLAAKYGNTEVARCLCLAGASIDAKNREGVAPEVCARVQGHTALGDLLYTLKRDGGTEDYIEQLIPTTLPITKIKIKFFGHSGSGKTTLIDSLKAGYFSSLFRRSKRGSGSQSSQSANMSQSANIPPIKGHVPVPVNSSGSQESNGEPQKTEPGHLVTRKGSWHSYIIPPTRDHELTIGGELPEPGNNQAEPESQQNSLSSLSFQSLNENYTRGIDVQQTSISGVGEVSVWEFSGSDCYYMLYDHFIGNANCIHVVLYSLADPLIVQIQQCSFWLAFLQSRIPPVEPLGDSGKSHKPAYVILVGTHGDQANIGKTGDFSSKQAEDLKQKVAEKFGHVFNLEETLVMVDCHAAGSADIKALKSVIQQRKQQLIEGTDANICNIMAETEVVAHSLPSSYSLVTQRESYNQGLPRVTQFLERVMAVLPDWALSLHPFPVVTWTAFIEYLHLVVNPLAGDEHLKEVIQQLQLMGEVVYLKCEQEDLIILHPKWLCSTVCGFLLSQEFRNNALISGTYTREEFQLAFPEYEARDILRVLSALGICIQCTEASQTEYEFPCYNGLEQEEGVWDQDSFGGECGGVVLKTSAAAAHHLLSVMYPRVQVQLRRSVARRFDMECELYQWGQGSKLSYGPLEAIIKHSEDQIEVIVRGPRDAKKACFFFLEEILGIIDQVLLEMSPGLPMDKYIVSSTDLKGKNQPMQWSPRDTMAALLEDGWGHVLSNTSHPSRQETLTDLLCFGSSEVQSMLVKGPDLHVSSMSTVTRQSLCQLLDAPHPMGKDWCMLAVQMGLIDKVPKLDVGAGSYSQTARLLDEWANDSISTIGKLVTALHSLGREDAADILLSGCSLYRITGPEHEMCGQEDRPDRPLTLLS